MAPSVEMVGIQRRGVPRAQEERRRGAGRIREPRHGDGALHVRLVVELRSERLRTGRKHELVIRLGVDIAFGIAHLQPPRFCVDRQHVVPGTHIDAACPMLFRTARHERIEGIGNAADKVGYAAVRVRGVVPAFEGDDLVCAIGVPDDCRSGGHSTGISAHHDCPLNIRHDSSTGTSHDTVRHAGMQDIA